MKNLILTIIVTTALLGCKNPNSIGRFTLNLEISDTSITEVAIGYQLNIGLTGIAKHLKKNADNKIEYVVDSISEPLPLYITIGKQFYQIWAEPKSDLMVYFNKDKVTFSGKGKKFADYYLESKDYWVKSYAAYEKRNPVLSGKPKGSKYFKVQDSITVDRINFLEKYFSKTHSSSVKYFIENEKNYLLDSDIFYKISGLTSLKDFRFYQEKLKLPTDTFLTSTNKFDFNDPALFNQSQFRRCFEWLPNIYIRDNKLDYLKDKGKAFDFVMSFSQNETCKKYIEIVFLNNLIEQSNEIDYSLNQFIKERIDKLSKNRTGIEIYISLLRTKFEIIVEKEKKSKELISLLNNPIYSEGIQIKDYSANKNLEVLRSVIRQNQGKILYVDFWAPWCRPCMGEMPDSKKLQEKFKDKNIVFVYLGVNCKEESWKSTIAELKLKGMHYLLNDQQSDEYYKIFDFKGIPHYIIVNKEGLVIDKNAPRPSEESKLSAIFINLLK